MATKKTLEYYLDFTTEEEKKQKLQEIIDKRYEIKKSMVIWGVVGIFIWPLLIFPIMGFIGLSKLNRIEESIKNK